MKLAFRSRVVLVFILALALCSLSLFFRLVLLSVLVLYSLSLFYFIIMLYPQISNIK